VQDREQALRAARSSGSLVVYEDGREVYRTRPENAALKESEPGAAAIPALDESTANERLIHRVEPEYGSDSIASDQPIVLQITVDRDGSVGSATVVSGDPVRASAALAAVRKWRYELRENEARTGFQTRVTFRSAAVQR
jgi:TonB family protein